MWLNYFFFFLIYLLQTQSDMLVVSHVAHILEQVVPKIEHPSESFMRELEEDLVKLIMKHGQMVINQITCR